MCTITHILGACKVSLQQWIFHNIIECLKIFILNIKQEVFISPKSSVIFVKKGAKVIPQKTSPVTILHHESYWIVIPNLKSNNCFPIYNTFFQLRPDITRLCNTFRKVIFIYARVKKTWNHDTVLRSTST